jgi:EpsI family protein
MKRSSALLCTGVCILVAQAISSQAYRRQPFLPSPPPLAMLPMHLGGWEQVQDASLDPEVLQMLNPSDSLDRQYQLAGGSHGANLFVAYYKSQLQAKNAHDPKVCLPGAGWNPTVSRVMDVSVPGSTSSFPVNYYLIARDSAEEVVLYWFQTYKGVYTVEQQLKAHRVLDAIADNRTDMALVRIVVPVEANGIEAADARAMQLAQLIYPQMLPYFPPKEKPGS